MPIMKTNTGTGGTDNTPPTAQRQSQQHQNKSIIQECLNNAQYIYETKGDVASAFEMLQKMSSSSSTLVEERDMPLPSPSMLSVDMNHNLALMAYLSCTSAPNNDTNTNEENKLPHYSEDKFQNQLEEMYAKENETLLEGNDDEGQGGTSIENHCLQADDDSQLLSSTSMRKLVLGHNLALNYAITNRLDEGVSVLLPLFRAFRKDESKNSINTNFELDDVMSNISFLLLDCIFASCYKVDLFNEILTFIDSLVLKAVADNRGEAFCSSLKFRQHCYKSKGLFLQCKFEQATIREVNIRVAKKELKNAMEIYHHKLAKDLGNSVERSRGESVTLDEGGSVQESVTPSLGSISNDPMQYAGSAHLIQHSDSGISNGADNHDQFRMKRRHRQNQCALYLKANLEHLKSNTKKSLKLCSEAQHCGVRQRETSLIQERQNVYEESKRSLDNQAAYHYNNLAIIHQAAGKFHLAMHYYSMSIAHVENIEKHGLLMFVENDGIVNPIPSPQILFNASICGQQIENYSTAHECMKRCIAASPHSFACDPFCWLHMGESCINSHVKLKRKSRSVANTW
jgi:tetratricopeptide (TPR) repeat protein